MKNDSLGDRMKNNYEDRYRFKLTRRTPAIMRLDGKAFHTLTRQCAKPFDGAFQQCMGTTAFHLMMNIQGAKCAYIQSDEISLLLTDYETLTTDAWFDYNIQKMCSVASGMAALNFSSMFGREGLFDCRVFNVPKEEVCNYFIWRQKDWLRNSIQMLAQAHFSHKELQNKKTPDMHEMLHGKDINWANLEPVWKNGAFIYRTEIGVEVDNTVIFTENREAVERYV